MKTSTMQLLKKRLQSISNQSSNCKSISDSELNLQESKAFNEYTFRLKNDRSLNKSSKFNKINLQDARLEYHSSTNLVNLNPALKTEILAKSIHSSESNKESSGNKQLQNNRTSISKVKIEHIEQDKLEAKCQEKNIFCKQQHQIQWNVFKLIFNKKYAYKDFVCGKCLSKFDDSKNFILHCLRQCEQIQHPQSSHFIKQKQVNSQQLLTEKVTTAITQIHCQKQEQNSFIRASKIDKNTKKLNIQKENTLDQTQTIKKAWSQDSSLTKIPVNSQRNWRQSVRENQYININELYQKQSNKDKSKNQKREFMLVVNKEYEKNNFYCGKCQEQLLDQQKLLQHVLNECFECENINSSHFIRLKTFLPNQQQCQPKFQLNNSNIPQIKISQLDFNPLNNHQYLTTKYKESFPLHLLGIFQLMGNRIYNENEKFTCGCGWSTNAMNGSKFHTTKKHNQIIPQNSSHIFVRIGSKELQQQILKLNVRVGNDMRQIWSCPCQPQKAMNKQSFVKHIFKIHKGISPLYKIISRRINLL